MSIFLSITVIAMLIVFSLDARQKRREYLKQHRSAQ